jgi:hypothetical protein
MLEAMATLGQVPASDAKYLLLAQNNVVDSVYSVSYPIMKSGGVLIIGQDPGLDVSSAGTIPKGPSQALVTLVLQCQGKAGTVTSIDPFVTGAELDSAIGGIELQVGHETSVELRVDTSLSQDGALVSALLSEFDVASTFDEVIIEGDSISAYVATPPPSVEIDGAFADWIGLTSADNDSADVANPNVDLNALGTASIPMEACFFVSVKGTLCQGAYAPSMRSKPVSGGGGGTIIERQRSGEDTLRIYVDTDLLNTTGKFISYPNKTIGADYLIEILGTDGQITAQSVYRYVSPDWVKITAPISAFKDSQRIELSVSSASIGAGTSFQAIIETTDWHSRGDWGWTGTVPDPWVVDASGNTYQTTTGGLWSYLGTPTLVPGDRVVDIALSADSTTVFIVTNTGRTFYWEIGTSTAWTAGQTRPIDTANYSEAVSMAFYQRSSAWLFTKNGSYFWLMDVKSSKKAWTYQDTAAAGITDFTDLFYAGGTMYALRSSANTGLLYSNNGNSFSSVTSPTGSTSIQSEFTYIPGGAGASDDRIFVLCEDGDIRYSSNGGSTWSSLGNLPRPQGANTSKYTGLGIDASGYMWVVTDTGYCFRSTDTVNYDTYVYTGKAPIGGIVAVVPLPIIPEFQYLFAPVIFSMVIVTLWRRRAKHRGST